MHPALSHWQARDGCLEVGGQSLTRLADRIGQTPFFAYERRLLDERIALLRRCLPAKVKLHYAVKANPMPAVVRSEEHTSELQSLMRISYAVFCLKKKK